MKKHPGFEVTAKIWTNMNVFVMYSRLTPAYFYENIILLEGICDLEQTISNSVFIYSLHRNSNISERNTAFYI